MRHAPGLLGSFTWKLAVPLVLCYDICPHFPHCVEKISAMIYSGCALVKISFRTKFSPAICSLPPLEMDHSNSLSHSRGDLSSL